MKKIITYVFTLCCSLSLYGQYISEVIDYHPAPGQHINTSWGTPAAAQSIVGGIEGAVSLGGFGGYIIFRFEQPVENHPDNPFGVDFTIFGNANENWSEPGIVSVMEDKNQNGIADDTWYELKGSDHYFSNCQSNYQVTYVNPVSDGAADVPWEDNHGGSGVIPANTYHTQAYYPLHDSFPGINQEKMTLEGTRIMVHIDSTFPGMIFSYERAFGYADNRPKKKAPYDLPDNPYTAAMENSGGDAFDISWAIDTNGGHIDLAQVHFIKVSNGSNALAEWLNELSTEIRGAVDVTPAPGIKGQNTRVVIRDLPEVIRSPEYQLEAFVFENGRLKNNQALTWNSSMENAVVNTDMLLQLSGSGTLTLTAEIPDNPGSVCTVNTIIDLGTGTSVKNPGQEKIALFPNPARGDTFITNSSGNVLNLYAMSGALIFSENISSARHRLNTTGLAAGIYFITTNGPAGEAYFKLIKE